MLLYHYMADLYLKGNSPVHSEASPLFADLSGLPPLLIHAGSHEVLVDDATSLHRRAEELGVDSTLEVWQNMPHVFHFMSSVLPEGSEAIKRVGSFLRYCGVV